MQWDKWKCIRNLGWAWEMEPGAQRSARIGWRSDSELPGGHCNNHFKCAVSRRRSTRLLPGRHIDLSRCLWSLHGAAGMMRSLVTSYPCGKPTGPVK